MSQPFRLYRLQQIDTQLDRATARLEEIEIAIRENKALRRAQKRMEQAEEQLQEARKNLSGAELDVQSQRNKIEQTEATLYGGKVSNPKELQDLQNESAALKRYLAVLEDRQLDAMLALDEAEQDYEEANQDVEKVKEEKSARLAELSAEKAILLKEVARLQVEREAAASGVPPDDMQIYAKLRIQRSGVAVAKVTDKACAACGSTLSAALLNSARLQNRLSRCDSCGRILYAG
ncbi:MAG TPA: C4-type zinc ribbon domain-containing protein [Anaerolineales bacterium]